MKRKRVSIYATLNYGLGSLHFLFSFNFQLLHIQIPLNILL